MKKMTDFEISNLLKHAREYPRYIESEKTGKRLLMSHKPKYLMKKLCDAVEQQRIYIRIYQLALTLVVQTGCSIDRAVIQAGEQLAKEIEAS